MKDVCEAVWIFLDSERRLAALRDERTAHQGRRLEAESYIRDTMRERHIDALVGGSHVFTLQGDDVIATPCEYDINIPAPEASNE